MAGKIDPKETVNEELLMSNVMEQEALVNLLQEKGIIKKAELLEGVKKCNFLNRKFSKISQANPKWVCNSLISNYLILMGNRLF